MKQTFPPRRCLNCKKEFVPKKMHVQYCGQECSRVLLHRVYAGAKARKEKK